MAINSKVIPLGVKVVSVFFYLIAAVLLSSTVQILIEGSMGRKIISGGPVGPTAASIGFAYGTILAILGILCILIGRGLWKGVKWAWIAAIILTSLWTLLFLFYAYLGAVIYLVAVVAGIAIIGYLLSARATFGRTASSAPAKENSPKCLY